MSLTVTLLIAIAVLSFLCFVAAHYARQLKSENCKLKDENEKQRATIVEMYNHAEELAQIHQDKSEVDQKINEAKTDEEISEIINGIIAANNSKLRNKAKGK